MKLNYKQTLLISLAFLSICAFWQIYDAIIPLILKNTFGFKETVTGTIMALDNVIAIFLLPLFGALSDRVNTRLGKRIPFIIIGTGFAVVLMMMLPFADSQQNLFLFIGALALLLIAMGFYRSPAVALMPDLTPKPLRSKANAIINLMGTAGAIYSLVIIMLFVKKSEKPNYWNVFMLVAALMVVSVLILVFTIREKKDSLTIHEEIKKSNTRNENTNNQRLPKEIQTSLYFILSSIFLWFMAYNAITTAFSRYAGEVWGQKAGGFAQSLLVATIAAILSYIPIGFISNKFGRKKTIMGGIILITFSYFAASCFTTYSPLINVVLALTGISWAAINVNSYPMVVEMSKGSDVGKYTGLYYTFSMAAQTITPILSGTLMENVSYRTLFPYAVCFSVLSLCTMIFVKHGDVKPIKKESILENFDVDD